MSNQTRKILIAIGVVVVVGIIAAIAVSMLSDRTPEAMRDSIPPYDVAAAVIPEDLQPEVMLPDEVGGYAIQVREPAGAGGVVASYGEGGFADQIHVVVDVLATAEDAQARVAETHAFYDTDDFTGDDVLRESVLDEDPAWLHVVYATDFERFTWSRDNIYFDVQAPPDTLDDFMAGYLN